MIESCKNYVNSQFLIHRGWAQDFKLAVARVQRKKKLQINIHIVLKNYKNTKSLFLNTLRCNHLLAKAKTK